MDWAESAVRLKAALEGPDPFVGPMRDPYGYSKLLTRYVRGDIEAEEFEAGLEDLIANDPDAVGQVGDPLPTPPPEMTDEPGAVVYYSPVQHGTPEWQPDGTVRFFKS